jgi:L-ascorbate metabolism protein UlaG (beta-lactamase superfamily)
MTGAETRSNCSLQYIGTATMLLNLGPFTVLTDPNFLHRGQRAYLGYGIVSKRLTEPAITVDHVPPLDAILLSHMHGDHWDRVAKRGLPRHVPIITTSKAAKALRRQGFTKPRALQTWDATTLRCDNHTLTVTATPGQHAHGIARQLLPPVMGSVLDYANADGPVLRLYITGDTVFVDELRAIPARFPDIDVAVLHLGGTTLPGGLLVTMDATQGADLLALLRPRIAVPVHNDDYGVFKSPLSAFLIEAATQGLDSVVRVVRPGETAQLIS